MALTSLAVGSLVLRRFVLDHPLVPDRMPDAVEVEKTFVDRLPRTVFRLTVAGREAVAVYRRQMLDVLESLNGTPG